MRGRDDVVMLFTLEGSVAVLCSFHHCWMQKSNSVGGGGGGQSGSKQCSTFLINPNICFQRVRTLMSTQISKT